MLVLFKFLFILVSISITFLLQNASNFKNEAVISFLHLLKVHGDDPEDPGPELTVLVYMNNTEGDGKDLPDVTGSNIKDKVNREVNAGMDADNPENFGKCIIEGLGVKSCVVMRGPIIGEQDKLQKKEIQTITKLHEFDFRKPVVTVRRCSKIGPGMPTKVASTVIKAKYAATVINQKHLDGKGRPINTSSKPVVTPETMTKKAEEKNMAGKELTMYEYQRKTYIQTWGMETLESFQPASGKGKASHTLLTRMEIPVFTERLLALAEKTKWSQLDATLQNSLRMGFALPVWGEGKNSSTVETKAFVRKLFVLGQKTKKVTAADAVIRMQLEVDATGKPMFNETLFLDEDQIKGIFSSTNRSLKRGLPIPLVVVGVDKDDEDNGEDKQTFEDSLATYEIRDQALTIDKDSEEIKNDLEQNEEESMQHPIKVAGEDLCMIAERMDLLISVDSVLAKHTLQQTAAIFEKIEKDALDDMDEPPAKKPRLTKKRKKELIWNFVKKHCNCVSFSRFPPY